MYVDILGGLSMLTHSRQLGETFGRTRIFSKNLVAEYNKLSAIYYIYMRECINVIQKIAHLFQEFFLHD